MPVFWARKHPAASAACKCPAGRDLGGGGLSPTSQVQSGAPRKSEIFWGKLAGQCKLYPEFWIRRGVTRRAPQPRASFLSAKAPRRGSGVHMQAIRPQLPRHISVPADHPKGREARLWMGIGGCFFIREIRHFTCCTGSKGVRRLRERRPEGRPFHTKELT